MLRTHVAAACAAVLVGAMLVFHSPVSEFLSNCYEDVRFTLNPSAETAYAIAEHHFRSAADRAYDLKRARSYYLRAAEIDPSYAMVYHQLARTSFIQGRFDVALAQITQQLKLHPDSPPSTYYVRGLILGFTGKYDEAAKDYEYFLAQKNDEWPGYNDYAWVLLKGEKPKTALDIVQQGLDRFPGNPWLLNSKAIALFELSRFEEARESARLARDAATHVTEEQWMRVNPGNDPGMAARGVQKLRESVENNIVRIDAAIDSSSASHDTK